MPDSLILKKINGTNEYNEPNITETKIIPCKMKYKNRLIKNTQGQDVNVIVEFTTTEAITIDDLITLNDKNWQILQVQPIKDFAGNILHYKGYI